MASSNTLSAFLASPCANWLIVSCACKSTFRFLRILSSNSARCNTALTCSGVSGSKRYTWQRDSRALFTLKDGFSVVAPINVISPDSTAPSNASCCALLKRCISSINTTGDSKLSESLVSKTSRNCFTPVFNADNA